MADPAKNEGGKGPEGTKGGILIPTRIDELIQSLQDVNLGTYSSPDGEQRGFVGRSLAARPPPPHPRRRDPGSP